MVRNWIYMLSKSLEKNHILTVSLETKLNRVIGGQTPLKKIYVRKLTKLINNGLGTWNAEYS